MEDAIIPDARVGDQADPAADERVVLYVLVAFCRDLYTCWSFFVETSTQIIHVGGFPCRDLYKKTCWPFFFVNVSTKNGQHVKGRPFLTSFLESAATFRGRRLRKMTARVRPRPQPTPTSAPANPESQGGTKHAAVGPRAQ